MSATNYPGLPISVESLWALNEERKQAIADLRARLDMAERTREQFRQEKEAAEKKVDFAKGMIEDYQLFLSDAKAEIARYRTALEKIMQCDCPQYEGAEEFHYCDGRKAKIAKESLDPSEGEIKK